MPPEISPKVTEDPAATMQPQEGGHQILDPNDPDDAAEDPEIIPNLVAHLDSLSDEQKAYIVYMMAPEVQAVIGLINGKEVYDYFGKFTDPAKSVQIIQATPTAPQPNQAQPNSPMQPQSPAPQAQPQQSAAPQNPAPFQGLR